MAEQQLFLRVVHGEDKGKVWDLVAPGPYLLGRSHTCNLSLTDRTVSARHARLSCEQGVWFLADQDSTHGTYLNDQRILGERPLFDRDMIRLGKSAIEFREYAELAPEDLAQIDKGAEIAE